MTRGYFAIIGKNKRVEECGYLSNSAYPAYYGLEILRAIADSKCSEFITKLREENDAHTQEATIDWFVRQPGDKETSRYEFPDYSYLLQRSSGILSIYHYGKLLYRIRPDEVPLYQFIFENESDLERALSIDPETNIEANDGTMALKRLIKEYPTVPLLQEIIDAAPAVSVPKKSDIRSVCDSLWHDRTVHVCDLSVYGPAITAGRELDWSVRTRRYNVSLEFRQDFCNSGYYFATLRAGKSFRSDIVASTARYKSKLSFPKAYMNAVEFVKKNQEDIVRLSVAERLHSYALDLLRSKSSEDEEAISVGEEAIKRIIALCIGHSFDIGAFDDVMCSALERAVYDRKMKGSEAV